MESCTVKFMFANEYDASALRNISIRAFESDRTKYGALPPGINTLEWHLSKIRGGMYYKIEVDTKIIGGMKLFDLGSRHFRLGSIFLEPQYQNQGIGTKAIAFIENEYPDVEKWSLDTPYLNFRNHHFYEKHGYVKVDEIQPDKNRDFKLFLYEKNK